MMRSACSGSVGPSVMRASGRDHARVDAEQLLDLDPVARLLPHFPPSRLLGLLTGLEAAAGERPGGAAPFVPVGEQDAIVGIDDDRVGRDAQVHASP